MRALLIGRFQPPHLGHLELLKRLAERFEHVVIVLGERKIDHDNPFTARKRLRMLKVALAAEGIHNYSLHVVRDVGDCRRWANGIARKAKFDVVFSNSSRVRKLFGSMGFEVRRCRRYYGISGKAIRAAMAAGKPWQQLVPAAVLEQIDPKR
jgi:nicotinamide-nucleotide adenylyltransferase